MTQDQRDIRCAKCAASEGPFELHHIALRANCQDASVPLCAPPRPCHHEETERQRHAGLITKRPIERGDGLQTLHALTEGVAGIFAAHARRAEDSGLAARNEQGRRATLRLLALTSDERPGSRGPRPISNRPARARGASREPNTTSERVSLVETLDALAGILPAIAAAATEPLPGAAELLPGVTAEGLRNMLSPAGSRRLARNLATLEAHPRARELAAAIEHDWRATYAAIEAPAVEARACGEHETAPVDFAQLVETVRGFYTVAKRWIELASALTTSAQPEDARAALERFLDRQADEAGDERRSAA